MKSRSVQFHKPILAFVLTLILLWGGMILSTLIPNTALQNHMEETAASYEGKLPFERDSSGRWNTTVDNYADTIWINIAWNMGNKHPILASLDTGYYKVASGGVVKGLIDTVNENKTANTDYIQYWHGSAMLIRFFHLFTSVTGIKWISFAVICAFLVLTCYMLLRRGHPIIAVALIVSLVAVKFWHVATSLEYLPSFVLCFIFCPIFLWAERNKASLLTSLAAVAGTAVAFFDFLTTETIVILVPLMLILTVRDAEGRLGAIDRNRGWVFKLLFWFGFTYVATFFAKWALVSLATGENRFSEAFELAGVRINGDYNVKTNEFFSKFPALAAVFANFSALLGATERIDTARVLIALAIVLLPILAVFCFFRKKILPKPLLRLLLYPAFLVLIRYLVLNNHSYLHAFFTYRALMVPIFVLLIALTASIDTMKFKARKHRK